MSDTSVHENSASLLVAPETTAAPKAKAAVPVIAQVQRDYGVHPLRQIREILAGRWSARRVGSNEYYDLRLFDPEYSQAEKQAFLGQGAVNVLNDAMNPGPLVPLRNLLNNKLLYTALLAKLGLRTTHTQALVSQSTYAGEVPTLRDSESIQGFLRDQARYPLFGKPIDGSLSAGSVRITSKTGEDLHLANGTTKTITAFADEVMQRYPNGFLFQSALSSHDRIAEMAGPSTACVRVVTVNDGAGIRPAYAVWKLPAPQAMSDNFWQAGSLLALLDLESGRIRSCRRGTGVKTEWFSRHPETGVEITGHTLPLWQETLDLARRAHQIFPEFGICGFDMAITPEGPVIVECNDTPAHMLYQLAAQRGIRTEDLAPTWDTVIARQKERLAQFRVVQKAGLKKRGIRRAAS